MDALDRAISSSKAELEEHEKLEQKHLEMLEDIRRNKQSAEIRYHSLIEAAKLRPISDDEESPQQPRSNKGRGKKPGTLSRNWVKTLGAIYKAQKDNKISYFEDIKRAHERSIGRTVDPSSIHDRIRYFKSQEPPIIIGETDEGFMITDDAIERFGLDDQDDISDSKPSDHMNGHAGASPQQEAGTMI